VQLNKQNILQLLDSKFVCTRSH